MGGVSSTGLNVFSYITDINYLNFSGDPGNAGDIATSQGAGNSTAWKQGPISGTKVQSVTAATSVTVTIGTTMSNTTYHVLTDPLNGLSSPVHYISAKTTTTFTVTYLSALTGSVSFDWQVIPS